MAKFQMEDIFGEAYRIPWLYYNSSLSFLNENKAVLTSANHAKIIYSGVDLHNTADGPAGTITKIRFYDADNQLALTISDCHFKFSDIGMDVAADFYKYESGNDTIIGSSVGDLLLFADNKGNDTIMGMGGNDYIYGSPGANVIDGGSGAKDQLDYHAQPAHRGLVADLTTGRVQNPWGKVDRVSAIESIYGTDFSDRFIGSGRNEFFNGEKGWDRVTGGGGNDQLYFAASGGRDTFVDFGNGNDSVQLFGLGVTNFTQIKAHIANRGHDAVLDFGHGDSITFLNFSKEDFVKSDFDILI